MALPDTYFTPESQKEQALFGDLPGAEGALGGYEGRGKDFRKEIRELKKQSRRGQLTQRENNRLQYLSKVRNRRMARDSFEYMGRAMLAVATAGGTEGIQAGVQALKEGGKKAAEEAAKKAAKELGKQAVQKIAGEGAKQIAQNKMKRQQAVYKQRALRAMEFGDFQSAQQMQRAGAHYTPGLESFIPIASAAAMKGISNLGKDEGLQLLEGKDPAQIDLNLQDKDILGTVQPLPAITPSNLERDLQIEQLDEMGGIPSSYSGSGGQSVVPQIPGQQVDLSAMLPPPPPPTPPVNLQPLTGKQPTLIPNQVTQPSIVGKAQPLPSFTPGAELETELEDAYYKKYNPDTSPSIVTDNYEAMSDEDVLQKPAPVGIGIRMPVGQYEEGVTTLEEYVDWLKGQPGYDGDYAKALKDAKSSLTLAGGIGVDIGEAQVELLNDYSGTWNYVEDPAKPGGYLTKKDYDQRYNAAQKGMGTWAGKGYPSYDQAVNIPYPQTIDEYREWFSKYTPTGRLGKEPKPYMIEKFSTNLRNNRIIDIIEKQANLRELGEDVTLSGRPVGSDFSYDLPSRLSSTEFKNLSPDRQTQVAETMGIPMPFKQGGKIQDHMGSIKDTRKYIMNKYA
tara:strand:- start:5288 stop:7144 length:1857 start_codon:yes stop_codon:yes gene_type:complete